MKKLLALLLLNSCAYAADELPKLTDMASLNFTVDGVNYNGIATLAQKKDYQIVFTLPAETIFFAIHNCHGEVLQSINKPKVYDFKYTPLGVESEGICVLIANAITAKGEKIFAMINPVFVSKEEPKEILEAFIQCNRNVSRNYGGFLCQARTGLTQRITFLEDITFAEVGIRGQSQKACVKPARKNSKVFDIVVQEDKCIYLFGTENKTIFNLITYGYKGVAQ